MLADCVDLASKEEVKTHFSTREGNYTLMPLSEYSRPNKNAFSQPSQNPVRISFSGNSNFDITNKSIQANCEKICFNIAKEIYVHTYNSIRKAADLTRPIDKRSYKNLLPTCHDFNKATTTSDSALLLVGLTGGQVQLIDPIRKEPNKIYNEERSIEESKVTCVRWLPGSPSRFLSAHGNGRIYVYDYAEAGGTTSSAGSYTLGGHGGAGHAGHGGHGGHGGGGTLTSTPNFQLVESGQGFAVHRITKIKSNRYPVFRWSIGQEGFDRPSINDLAFSPCKKYLAVASQDGFMRIFNFAAMTLHGSMRSYFGGILCISWSSDGRYIATGGEDDLITIYSVHECRVVCRGSGHKSWINAVAFDSYISCPATSAGDTNSPYDDDGFGAIEAQPSSTTSSSGGFNRKMHLPLGGVLYRIGSVGQDCLFCIWEITEEELTRSRQTTPSAPPTLRPVVTDLTASTTATSTTTTPNCAVDQSKASNTLPPPSLGGATLDSVRGKRNSNRKVANGDVIDTSFRLLGTPMCPAYSQVPVLEPVVRKKVSNERLTAVEFKDECLLIASQDGIIHTWARPGRTCLSQNQSHTFNHGLISRSISPPCNQITSIL